MIERWFFKGLVVALFARSRFFEDDFEKKKAEFEIGRSERVDLDVPRIFWVARYFSGESRCGGAWWRVATVGRFLGFPQILFECDEQGGKEI